ncbi:MAG: hypothetical protein COA39_011855 [Sulfurimonas sp.]|nr:hypothetical protein [Sulfurimonas sp.]
MAITFITGVSGSGKSYFSVYTIYMLFLNSIKRFTFKDLLLKKKPLYAPANLYLKYDYIYTNLNQFNFKFHPLIRPLDIKLLRKNLVKLRRLKVEKEYTDTALIEVAKEMNLYNVLIVMDEAQDYLPKKVPEDDELLWWFTYHRHLNHDIHVLTQHIDQLSTEYRKNGVNFYRMPPPTMAIFSNRFTVGYYSCVGMTAKCREKSFTIPFIKEVGELYVSGNKTDRKSILRKYFFIFPLMILFSYLAWQFFNHERMRLSPVDKKSKSEITNDSNDYSYNDPLKNDSLSVYKDFHFVSFKCISDTCIFKDFNIPIDFVLYLKNNTDSIYSHTTVTNYSMIKYDFIVDDNLYNFLISSFDTSSSKKKKKKDYESNSEIKLFGSDK